MDSLRVCHVVHDTQFGGTESMLYKVIAELKDRHEFQVVSLLGCGPIGKAIEALGVPVHSLHIAESGKPKPHRLIRAMTKLRELKPDVVQTWAYHSDLVGGMAAKIATKATVVWNVRHATLDPKIDSANVLRSAKLCGRFSGWVPDQILLNAESAMPAHELVGYQTEKMRIISNGFDTNVFKSMPEAGKAVREELGIPTTAKVVGMCGRFHHHKGQEQFVAVAEQLAERHSDVVFVMVGPGCDYENEKLQSWLTKSLTDRFRLLGSRTDIPQILNALDVYLLPSITEGMPNVVGEAMACGVPVVATDVGDAGRLMGDCGKLVPSQDVVAMSNAVDGYLRLSAEERAKIGQRNQRRIAENFELSAIAGEYEKVWQKTREARHRKASTPMVAGTANAGAAKQNAPTAKPKLVHVTTIPMTQFFFLRGQFAFMNEAGFDVHSVSSPGGPGDYLNGIANRDPVTTHAIPISRRITPLKDAQTVYQLWKLFRKLRPEIVQLSTPKAALLGAIAAKFARVPIRIYQVRGLSSESEKGIKRKIYQWCESFTARLCNGCLVNARSLLQYAKQARILSTGIVAGNGMSNGVDLERFDPKSAPADMREWDSSWNENVGPVVGFVGRLTRDKGLEDIYHAWKALRDEHPGARLLLIGPWESENAVTKDCYEGLLSDPRVVLTGTQDDVVPFYKCMDVFVYPSHGTEGFPNAPMEAAAMELPVIATRVIGCVDAVSDGETGRIISPRSPAELERELRNYFESPLQRTRHGKAGRERIRSGFAPHELWNEFREYYVHLLRREQQCLPTTTSKGDRERKTAA